MPRIHPTAVVSTEAQVSDDVEIGPYAIVEGEVTLGAGTSIGPHAHLIGPLTMGRGNQVHSFAAIGPPPQDRHYTNERSGVAIGDENVFREQVTVHRATGEGETTRIGSRNMFMVASHVGHNCLVGDDCVLVNGALLGGHVEVQDRAIISGHSVVHQFCRVGRLAMMMGLSGVGRDVPPFMIVAGITQIAGFNRIGLQRAGFTPEAVDAVRLAYRCLYKRALPVPAALERIEAEVGRVPEITELVEFIRGSERGICTRAGGHLRYGSAVDRTAQDD